MVLFLSFLWSSILLIGHTVSLKDVREETQCYSPTTVLELDCGPSSVISVDWNFTFFGQSACGHTQCCPRTTVCTFLVTDTNRHQHLEDLNACNGKTSCTVSIGWVGPGCDSWPTDYETVTYECVSGAVSPVTTSTVSPVTTSTVSPVTTSTERQPTKVEVEHTSSTRGAGVTVTHPVTQTGHPVTQTNHPMTQTTDAQSESQSNSGVVIAVSVIVFLVVVVVVTVALFAGLVCYRRGFAHGKDNTGRKTTKDQTLATIYEPLEDSYLEPAPAYTDLQMPQYERLNESQITNVRSSSVPESIGTNGGIGQTMGGHNVYQLEVPD